ncbi:protein THEMIS [Gastrophryne carolinensis]
MTTTLQICIESLDPTSLPRILQIQSGFYHGGSIYELCGNETSLSTGDVIKVTSFKIKKALAHLYTSNEYSMLPTMELPLDFSGFFRVVADKDPYESIEALVQALDTGSIQSEHPCFFSSSDLHIGDITIAKGTNFMFRCRTVVKGEMSAKFTVKLKGRVLLWCVPLSYTGEFFECQDERKYTLNEILSWNIKENRTKTFLLADILDHHDFRKTYHAFINKTMSLTPVYDIQVQMQYGGTLSLSSDLDVEVLDITEHFSMNCFTEILTTQDIFEKNSNEFPLIAEIVENPVKCCKSYNFLKAGNRIIVHRKYQADRIIASEIKSDTLTRHFLIPSNYKGKFKRRPRFFPTIFDLNVASTEIHDLHVVATKAFTSPHQEFSSICVGDVLHVRQSKSFEFLHEGKMTAIDGLECIKKTVHDQETIRLPLYVEGGFIEVVNDDKQYYLSELCEHFLLPLTVKVSVRDLFTVGEDILSNTSVLKLEEQITDSYLLVSLNEYPDEAWELPVFRLNLSFKLHGNFTGKLLLNPTRSNTEEINEEEYYMARRYENNLKVPPPRPPKTPLYVTKSKTTLMQEGCLKTETSEETLQLESASCRDLPETCRQEDSKKTNQQNKERDSTNVIALDEEEKKLEPIEKAIGEIGNQFQNTHFTSV